MPNRRRHRRAGQIAGAGYAAMRALVSPSGDPIPEAIGGLIGGRIRSAIPDVLEPPSWDHRRFCHSWLASGSIVAVADRIEEWAESCRRRAHGHRRLSTDLSLPPAAQLLHALVAVFWSVAAGLLNGAMAGYLSHLALDLGTATRLPLC